MSNNNSTNENRNAPVRPSHAARNDNAMDDGTSAKANCSSSVHDDRATPTDSYHSIQTTDMLQGNGSHEEGLHGVGSQFGNSEDVQRAKQISEDDM